MIVIGHCTQRGGGDDLQFVVVVAYLENCMTVLWLSTSPIFCYFSGSLKNMVFVESNLIY